jgi:hypothetical protein
LTLKGELKAVLSDFLDSLMYPCHNLIWETVKTNVLGQKR